MVIWVRAFRLLGLFNESLGGLDIFFKDPNATEKKRSYASYEQSSLSAEHQG